MSPVLSFFHFIARPWGRGALKRTFLLAFFINLAPLLNGMQTTCVLELAKAPALSTLGMQGGHGAVIKVRREDGTYAAQKSSILPLDTQLIREIDNLRFLNQQADRPESIPEFFFAYESLDGRLHFQREWIDGETFLSHHLAHRVTAENFNQSVQSLLPHLKEVFAALEWMHKNGVSHLDLKPKNIMITPQGKIKIIDFGISKRGNQRPVGFTPGVTAPEVIRSYYSSSVSEPVGPKSDDYSFGKLMLDWVGMVPTSERGRLSLDQRTVLKAMIELGENCSNDVPFLRTRQERISQRLNEIERLAASLNVVNF